MGVGGLIQGMAIGFTAGIVPGPLLALFLSHTVRRGWRRTLPAVLAPLVSDGPIILLVVFILAQVPGWLLTTLRIAGGLYLVYLAARIFLRRTEVAALGPESRGDSRLFRRAVLINLLNPNPYIFWGVALGPVLISLGRANPLSAAAFLVGFYGVMIGTFAGWVYLFGWTAMLPAGAQRGIPVIASLVMAGFGIYQVAVVRV
jgi:threonine/homoserine/homoserine lactone efflux protein